MKMRLGMTPADNVVEVNNEDQKPKIMRIREISQQS